MTVVSCKEMSFAAVLRDEMGHHVLLEKYPTDTMTQYKQCKILCHEFCFGLAASKSLRNLFCEYHLHTSQSWERNTKF